MYSVIKFFEFTCFNLLHYGCLTDGKRHMCLVKSFRFTQRAISTKLGMKKLGLILS